jgi:uncharacterized protein YbjT (DUF2867 family)
MQPRAPNAAARREVVLVTGATGRTGRLVYAGLVDAGYDTRALVRSQGRAREALGCGACGEASHGRY